MPAVSVQCPQCGRSYSIDGSLVGRKGLCKNCGSSFALTPSGELAGPAPGSGDAPASGPLPSAWSSSTPLPEKIGRFLIKARLGAGACGAVYRAFDPTLDREVALKVPHPELQRDEKAVSRFLREAKAAARLHHPYIVPVYEAGIDGETSYIASAFIAGRSLADAVDDGPFDPRRAARIVAALADALHAAHQQGIVHRDVKPANILLDGEDRPRLTDFGLARLAASSVKLTKVGSILGTPAYLAPEQARGKSDEAEPASDQYSLGVTFYELLCGAVPFAGPLEVVIFNTLHTPPPPLREEHPEIPAELETICLKALSKKPAERYASCRELARDLGRWLTGRPTSLEISVKGVATTVRDTGAVTATGSTKQDATSLGRAVLEELLTEAEPPPLALPAMRRTPSGGRRRPRWRWTITAAAALLLPLLGVVLYITTNHGTVKIELSDPSQQVEVRVDGDSIAVNGLGDPLTLRVGNHRIEVTGKDFETQSESFTLKRGGLHIARFELAPRVKPTIEPVAVATKPSEGIKTPGAAGTVPPAPSATTASRDPKPAPSPVIPADLAAARKDLAPVPKGKTPTELVAVPAKASEGSNITRTNVAVPVPFACWTFESNARDVIGTLHGKLMGAARVRNGRLYLDGKGAHVKTAPLSRDIREKTFEAWVMLPTLEQPWGAAVMAIEAGLPTSAAYANRRGHSFDAIEVSEREPGKWVAGSDWFRRGRDLNAPYESANPTDLIHLAIVYDAEGGIALYRQGQHYGDRYIPAGYSSNLQTYPAGEAHVLLGLRHAGAITPTGGASTLLGAIEEARLYDRALTAEEVAASYRAGVNRPAAEQPAGKGPAQPRAESAAGSRSRARKSPADHERKGQASQKDG